MSNSTTRKTGTEQPHHKTEAGSPPTALPQGIAACMAMTQKLMQANLDMTTHAFDFMNRRAKAQVALWNSLGQSRDADSATDMRRTFVETVTKDYAEELGQLAEIARKNIEEASRLVTTGIESASTPGKSS
jgi:hypothetical protein